MNSARIASLRFEGLHVVACSLLGVIAVLMAVPVEAGEIEGTVVYEGMAPKMRPIAMDGNPDCATLHSEPVLTDWLVLGEGQSVGHVLVYVVSGLPKGKTYAAPSEAVILTQKGCVYSPHVFGIRAGQSLKVMNPEGVQHNIHALPSVNSEFNRSSNKAEITHTFKKTEGVFPIKCDSHNWMQAFCGVFDHPFFTVTGADGAFSISGLEAGEYEIEVWHEKLGTRRATVTVPSEGAATVNFTLTRPNRTP